MSRDELAKKLTAYLEKHDALSSRLRRLQVQAGWQAEKFNLLSDYCDLKLQVIHLTRAKADAEENEPS